MLVGRAQDGLMTAIMAVRFLLGQSPAQLRVFALHYPHPDYYHDHHLTTPISSPWSQAALKNQLAIHACSHD